MPGEYPFAGGPYLSAAFFCERILQEAEGIKSVIRIVDRFIQTAVGPNPPPDLIPFDHSFTLFLRFVAGRARGVMQVKLELVKPSGEKLPPRINSVLFEGEEDRSIDIVTIMTLRLEQTGVYWIYVSLNDVRITQIPFRVIYMPQIRQVGGQSGIL